MNSETALLIRALDTDHRPAVRGQRFEEAVQCLIDSRLIEIEDKLDALEAQKKKVKNGR